MTDTLTNRPIPSLPTEPPEVPVETCPRCGSEMNWCPAQGCDSKSCSACWSGQRQSDADLGELMCDTGGCSRHAMMLAGTLIYKQGREINRLNSEASRTKAKLTRIRELCQWEPTGTTDERLIQAIQRLAKIEVNCE